VSIAPDFSHQPFTPRAATALPRSGCRKRNRPAERVKSDSAAALSDGIAEALNNHKRPRESRRTHDRQKAADRAPSSQTVCNHQPYACSQRAGRQGITRSRSGMKRALNLAVVILLIILSTALLAATIGKSGVRLTGDTEGYLGSAMSLAIGEGFGTQGYSPVDDTIAFTQLTHYPPLLSSFYSLFIIGGIDPAVTLTVVSVFGWFMLLIATAMYVFTNTKSYSALILAILLTSITYPYLWHYG